MVMPGTLRNKNLCVCLTVKPPHSICLQPYRGIRNVLVFPAQFLVLVVQALVLDVISGGFARFLCRGWESSLLNFSDEGLEASSPLEWLCIGCFFLVMHWGGFHVSKNDS